MRRTHLALLPAVLLLILSACQPASDTSAAVAASNVGAGTVALAAAQKGTKEVIEKIVKTEEEWKKVLTPEQFQVMRKHGTERASTGEYATNHDKGIYVCAACGLTLFDSATKFDSGTGWPSFWQPIDPTHIGTSTDKSFFSVRTEVHCARCGGHLGHVFDDGPKPTGLRYCMNSVSLKLQKQ
jgi:peptide-methionine (R)-S-oxide reductase